MFENFITSISLFKEVVNSKNPAVYLSIIVAGGVGLLLLYWGIGYISITFTAVITFSACMAVSLWFKRKKEEKEKMLNEKAGLLGERLYTYKHPELWHDQNFTGVGWEIFVYEQARNVFLLTPICLKCKTNLIQRRNKKGTGWDLKCTDCKATFEVDDVADTRSQADASLQGDVRKNPDTYFHMRI